MRSRIAGYVGGQFTFAFLLETKARESTSVFFFPNCYKKILGDQIWGYKWLLRDFLSLILVPLGCSYDAQHSQALLRHVPRNTF